MSTPPDLHADVLSRLAAAEAVEAAGTPGPWATPVANVFRVIAPEAPHTNPPQGRTPPYPWRVIADAGEADASARDMALIVAARNAYPATLRWVRQTVTAHEFVIDTGGTREYAWCTDDETRWPCDQYRHAAAVLGVHIPPRDQEQA